MARGKLVVLEGLDRAGKSTQCAKLVENLRAKGRMVQALRFPDRTTPIGKMIASYLTGDTEQEDHVVHLLFSANRWELAAKIQRCIEEGTDVVIDRYHYSGYVYSMAKNNPALAGMWARSPDVGLPQPDICVFLAISVENASRRGGFGEERYEKLEMQERVREIFKAVQRNASKTGELFVEVDGGERPEEVEKKILHVVESRFEEVDTLDLPLGFVKA